MNDFYHLAKIAAKNVKNQHRARQSACGANDTPAGHLARRMPGENKGAMTSSRRAFFVPGAPLDANLAWTAPSIQPADAEVRAIIRAHARLN